jgi:putative integral membrane protein (TIGR02587 family)
VRPINQSLREYGRGVAGGLLFSLPLLYTMELWATGFIVEPDYLIAYMATTVLLLLGYNRFAGMRQDANCIEVLIDSIEEMGIGLAMATGVLLLLGQIDLTMSYPIIVGKIVTESMMVAVGVSVGTAQLGLNGHEEDTGMGDTPDSFRPPRLVPQLVLGVCGAVLFAANIGPTEEVVIIAAHSSPLKLIGLVITSVVVGSIILYFSDFKGTERHVRHGGAIVTATGLLTCYLTAMAASALLLWFFSRFENVPVDLALAEIVVLAFPAMLGASAGRLLIQ